MFSVGNLFLVYHYWILVGFLMGNKNTIKFINSGDFSDTVSDNLTESTKIRKNFQRFFGFKT